MNLCARITRYLYSKWICLLLTQSSVGIVWRRENDRWWLWWLCRRTCAFDFEHQIKTQILPAYIAETSLAPQMWQVHAASGVRAEA